MDTEERTDLRSILSQVTDEAEQAAQPRPETPIEKPDDTAPEPKAETGDRPRGPDGKFLPKEAVETVPDEKPAAEPADKPKPEAALKDAEPKTTDQAPPAAPQAAIQAPQHWSQADKEKFNALPAEAKPPFLDMYKRLEGWYTPKLQRLSQVETEYGPIEQMFAPYREALKARGQAPADIIRMWGTVEQTLVNHKGAVDSGQTPTGDAAATVARMIASYRINPQAVADALNAIAQGQQPAGQVARPAPTAVDPQLRQELDWLKQRELDRESQANQDRLNTAQRQIDTFANEKNGEGNLAHPFFAEVEQDMMALAQLDRAQGKTPDLSEIYDRAVWANPATRDKLLALQKEGETKRAAVERKAQAEAAKRAAVSISGSPAGTTKPQTGNANRSLRQTIEDTAAELDAA